MECGGGRYVRFEFEGQCSWIETNQFAAELNMDFIAVTWEQKMTRFTVFYSAYNYLSNDLKHDIVKSNNSKPVLPGCSNNGFDLVTLRSSFRLKYLSKWSGV